VPNSLKGICSRLADKGLDYLWEITGHASRGVRRIAMNVLSLILPAMLTLAGWRVLHVLASYEVLVKFQKRAHNPLLIAAGFDKTEAVIPWLGRKRLRLVFG